LEEALSDVRPLLDIVELQRHGLVIRTINVDAFLGTLNQAFDVASILQVFRGRNDKKVPKTIQNIFGDLLSLGGLSFHWLRPYTDGTGLGPEMFDIWRSWRSLDSPNEFYIYNTHEMMLRLKIAKAKRIPAYTLSIRNGRGAWGRKVGYGLDQNDFYDLCDILEQLVQEIVKEGQTHWMEVFVLEPSIPPIRRIVVRYFELRRRGFQGRPDSVDDLIESMDDFEAGLEIPPEENEAMDSETDAASATSGEVSLPDVSDIEDGYDSDQADRQVNYIRQRSGGFTPEQDRLLLERVSRYGSGRIRWVDVYDPRIFPAFTVEMVRSRYRWLARSRN
jgi:hypothetical protein